MMTAKDKADKFDELIVELRKLLQMYSPENKETGKEFSALIEKERQSLREFFGKEIEVPPLPPEITPEKYEYWKKIGFELHYLPPETMSQDKNFPGWKQKPNDWFYDEIAKGNIDKSAIVLPGAWVLTDGRIKPNYDDGKQMYDSDPLGDVLEKMRKERFIQGYKHVPDPKSRFGISWDELHTEEFKKALAEVLMVSPSQVRLPREIEFNTLNQDHPEQGKTTAGEWFEDAYGNKSQYRLLGGLSGNGGLSYVYYSTPGRQYDDLGFRPLIVFSS